MALLGLGKLVSGHKPFYLLGPWAYYSVATVELLLSAMLASGRCVRGAAIAVQVIAVVGIAIAVASTTPCGCFGDMFESNRALHMMAAGFIGMLASLIHWQCRRPD
jgi:hypothetical protein